MTIRATFEPFTDRQKRTITEAFARPDIYDYLAKLAKKLHRTQKEIIYQARELGVCMISKEELKFSIQIW